jgi:hypothetical protein
LARTRQEGRNAALLLHSRRGRGCDKRRAEKLEAQAGSHPWYDWTDFRDEAEWELLDELQQVASRLNMRAHRIERAQAFGDGTAIICTLESEPDMVVFKVGVRAVWSVGRSLYWA